MSITGFLHPGAMGASLAETCAGDRRWVSAGRSEATAARAGSAGLADVGSLDELVAVADAIVSICPPHAAVELAATVAGLGYNGIYIDANAIAPATSRVIGELFDHYVDGGVVGPPAQRPGTTRMYLSGADAPAVAELWQGSDLEVRLVEGGAGAASALKVAYAAWTKGTSALLLTIRALAEAEGISGALLAEWETSQPDLIERSERAAERVGPKAWRFAGEMREIAAALTDASLPDGFHLAAAETYERLAVFKDRVPGPTLDDAIIALNRG